MKYLPMLFKTNFTFILMIAGIIVCFACHSQVKDQSHLGQKASINAIIVINFKNKSDKAYTNLTQLNSLYFQPPLVKAPPYTVDSADTLRTILSVKIQEPCFLAVGFNVFYIEPGDSLNMDYEIIKNTKTSFKDTITINHGNVFFISPQVRKPQQSIYWAKIRRDLKNIRSADQITHFLSVMNLNEIFDGYTAKMYADFPNLEPSEIMKEISLNSFYWSILFELKFLYSNTWDVSLKDAMQNGVSNMVNNACSRKDRKINSTTWGKYLSLYNFFKETTTNADSISTKFRNCNDTIKQYILLNLFKDGLLSDNAHIKMDSSVLLAKFTYPPFREAVLAIFKKSPNRGVEKLGYINNTMRNIKLYAASGGELSFDDLFKTADEPFLLFDFAGSWCKPCLDEIALYAKTRRLDESKKVKPIWIFFENDKSKGFEVINRYKLKKENCFVIEGDASRQLMNEFSSLFDWAGEFPHHFLFTNEGKIVNKNAPGLHYLKEEDLPDINFDGDKNIPPPLPPLG